MNREKILQKANELEYRINLNKSGLEKAKYNLKNSSKLNLTIKQINNFTRSKIYYEDKIKQDIGTYNGLVSFLNDNAPSLSSDYMFKCTFPYNKVDNLSGYQTSIVVDDSVVGLFANGVNYKDVISCLDENDVHGIESKFMSFSPTKKDKNVTVEVIDDNDTFSKKDAVIAFNNSTKDIGIVSIDNISECYSDYKKYSFKNLNGEAYTPCVPSLDDILAKQNASNQKADEYKNYKALENKVVEKINLASDKMTRVLNKYENM